jgi:isoleucyl-tRNA synthetase
VFHGLHNFCAVTLSSFYFDILKDRLYTLPRRGRSRRAAQSVLYRLADGLTRLMAPVLCFTAEEVWQELEALRGGERFAGSTVHARLFPEGLEVEDDEPLLGRFERLGSIRDEVNRALEIARRERRIGTGLEAHVVIDADDDTVGFLSSFGEDLRFLFITSGVSFGEAGDGAYRSEQLPGLAVEVVKADGTKCERCWSYTLDVGSDDDWPGVCGRCAVHVREALAGSEAE